MHRVLVHGYGANIELPGARGKARRTARARPERVAEDQSRFDAVDREGGTDARAPRLGNAVDPLAEDAGGEYLRGVGVEARGRVDVEAAFRRPRMWRSEPGHEQVIG